MRCVWEHNGKDTLLYSLDFVGAFTRGETPEIAMGKMKREIEAYMRWSGLTADVEGSVRIVQEKSGELNIKDADSDVIFDDEQRPMTMHEYQRLKMLALKSAVDFHRLYELIPDKDVSCLPARLTFYGQVPRTAREMYEHTKSVNEYYFAEIGVEADNKGTIDECRRCGFEALERTDSFLCMPAVEGSYGELWSLRKVLRRFIWHDRIHAKAMYRMAMKTFGEGSVKDIFFFGK